MERWLCWVTLCLLGLGLWQTDAFEVRIKDDATNNTCIFASMKVNFTIQYDTSNGTSSVVFQAPDNVTTDGSKCGGSSEAPLLTVSFGSGHSWSLNFTKDDTTYSGSVLSFTYNTNDTKLFPDAKRLGLLTSVLRNSFFGVVPLNESYKCSHDEDVTSDNVRQSYRDVTLQAYIQNSTLGREFRCSADIPVSPSPSTPNTTSPSTASPKPTPKPVDKPTVGNYSVSNGNETCLLASMGLQLNASLQVDGKIVWTSFNIDPNSTESSGSCGNSSAVLRLNDHNVTVVEFYFSIKNKNFHLQEVNVTLVNGTGTSHTMNSNLSLWEASLGNSYLCHKEQLIHVSEDLLINTFDVRVQPFSVRNGTYSTAEDCFTDQDFTIPIVVGAILGALVILVMVAYIIGRRNRHSAGYEHF